MENNFSYAASDPSYFASHHVWGDEELVGIEQVDRLRHCHVIGQTGSGKTTLLRNLIVQDITAGRGVAFLDPHGDQSEELLDCIPPHRFDHVVYLDPSDLAYPVGWNVLAHVPPDDRHRLTENVVAVFRGIWKLTPERTPRLPRILYNCIRALLDLPPSMGASLLGVPRLLVDQDYRERVVAHVRDPQCRSFWAEELPGKGRQLIAEAIDPVQSRIGTLLSSEALRNTLGQAKRRVDPRFLMDEGRILIANLAKGKLGEEASNLLGALIVTGFETAALSRAELPEERRRPFNLVADEFQNFVTLSFASTLSEARKYALSLTLAHQYLDQLEPEIRSAVFGNAGTTITFRVGPGDAEEMARQFAPVPAATLVELSRYEVCVKLLRDGDVSQPFFARTLEPLKLHYGKRETVVGRSRQRYARPRAEVEGKISRWVGAAHGETAGAGNAPTPYDAGRVPGPRAHGLRRNRGRREGRPPGHSGTPRLR